MAEVSASVALAEAGAAPAAPAPTGEPKALDFTADGPADRGDAILDEVLAGTEPEPAAEPAAEPAKPTEEPKQAETPVAEPAPEPTNDIEAAKLRKGFAKLADERQKALDLQNKAKIEIAAAQSYAGKAQKHDEIVAALEADPAGFLLKHGGDALVQKALQGFIDQEKSPAEREIAKLRAEQTKDREEREQRQVAETAANWRRDITSKVQADERFDLVNTLGLHNDVIDVITQYYQKHSERDEKGNVTVPAILPWDQAAQAVEDHRSGLLSKSKRYGKREPAAAAVAAEKDAPPAKKQPAPVKKAPTTLSSVPVAETPALQDDLPTNDNDERERRILAEFGL